MCLIKVAAQFVIDELGLEPDLRPLMEKYGVSEPWQALTEIRTAIYNEIVADPQVLRDNQWPHTVGVERHNDGVTDLNVLIGSAEPFCSTAGDD